MRNIFITAIAAMAFAGAAAAQTITGEVALDVAENAASDYAVTPSFDLGVAAGDLATVSLGFVAEDGSAVTLDTWTVGTQVGGIGIAIGDDNGLFPGAEGEQTLAAPAMAESVKLSYGDAAVAVGFTDWGNDLTDISNIQGAYTLGGVAGLVDVTAAVDYNMDTKNTVVGAGISGLQLGGIATLGGVVTYDTDASAFGYEAVAGVYGITAYVNGDDTDAFQNVGGSYEYKLGGATLSAGANYDVNASEFAPTAGISFSF